MVPLAMLAACALCYRFREWRPGRMAAGAAAILCIAAFLAQANVSYYAEWRFDAGTRRIVDALVTRYGKQRRLTVRASWVLEPGLNFYRLLYRLNWEPVDRGDVHRPGDVAILTADDAGAIPESRLDAIYRDAISGTFAAAPRH